MGRAPLARRLLFQSGGNGYIHLGVIYCDEISEHRNGLSLFILMSAVLGGCAQPTMEPPPETQNPDRFFFVNSNDAAEKPGAITAVADAPMMYQPLGVYRVPQVSGIDSDHENADTGHNNDNPSDETAAPSDPDIQNSSPRSARRSCMGLGPLGRCLGNVTEWCDEDDTLQSTDCAETGQVCGWVDEESGWGCVGGQTDMTEPQPDVADTPLEEINDAPTEACGSEIEAEVVTSPMQVAEKTGSTH